MSSPIAELFQRLTHGVYVVGVASGEHRNAFTAAWVMQVSFDPLLLILSINPQHSSYAILNKGKVFSINILKEEQLNLASHFGRPASTEKLAHESWMSGRTGAPLLRDALAWIECEVLAQHPAGDHILVLGRVIDGRLLDAMARPMIYRDTGDMDGASNLFPSTLAPHP